MNVNLTGHHMSADVNFKSLCFNMHSFFRSLCVNRYSFPGHGVLVTNIQTNISTNVHFTGHSFSMIFISQACISMDVHFAGHSVSADVHFAGHSVFNRHLFCRSLCFNRRSFCRSLYFNRCSFCRLLWFILKAFISGPSLFMPRVLITDQWGLKSFIWWVLVPLPPHPPPPTCPPPQTFPIPISSSQFKWVESWVFLQGMCSPVTLCFYPLRPSVTVMLGRIFCSQSCFFRHWWKPVDG